MTDVQTGIGRATALLFAKEGCQKIAICDRNETSIQETKDLIKRDHPDVNVKAICFDVSDETAVTTAVRDVVEDFGRLDYCANIAGIVLLGKQTAEMETSFFDKHHNINLRGLFLCERAQIAAMLQQEPLQSRLVSSPYQGIAWSDRTLEILSGHQEARS